jgi:hypothetical protein
VSGRTKLSGSRMRPLASGTHISTPGLAALTVLIPRLKCLAISGRLSPFSSMMAANKIISFDLFLWVDIKRQRFNNLSHISTAMDK